MARDVSRLPRGYFQRAHVWIARSVVPQLLWRLLLVLCFSGKGATSPRPAAGQGGHGPQRNREPDGVQQTRWSRNVIPAQCEIIIAGRDSGLVENPADGTRIWGARPGGGARPCDDDGWLLGRNVTIRRHEAGDRLGDRGGMEWVHVSISRSRNKVEVDLPLAEPVSWHFRPAAAAGEHQPGHRWGCKGRREHPGWTFWRFRVR